MFLNPMPTNVFIFSENWCISFIEALLVCGVFAKGSGYFPSACSESFSDRGNVSLPRTVAPAFI